MYYQGNNNCLHLHVLIFIYSECSKKYRMYRNTCKNNLKKKTFFSFEILFSKK